MKEENKSIPIEISKLVKNPFQYRIEFELDSLYELSNDIAVNGLHSPINVLYDEEKDTYYIIAGERRTIACKLANFNSIAAYVIKGSIDDPNVQRLMKVKMYNENQLHRNPTPIEEGVSYRKDLRPTKNNNYNPSYNSISQLAGFILNLDKIKTLTPEQNKIRLNKIKEISKKILEKAATTEYIEDEIYKGGVDDNYLMIKVAFLCQEIQAPKVKARALLEKNKKTKFFSVLEESEVNKMSIEEKSKYLKQMKTQDSIKFINEFYFKCNEYYKKNCLKIIDSNEMFSLTDEKREDYKNLLQEYINSYRKYVDKSYDELLDVLENNSPKKELTLMNLEHGKISKDTSKIKIDINLSGLPLKKQQILEKYLEKVYDCLK